VTIADRYIFVNITTTPLNGETYCQQTYGTHLASIHSQQENDLAVEICDVVENASGPYGCAIGLIDGMNESNSSRYGWEWTDSSTYDYNSGYTNWKPGEPNEYLPYFSDGEDCVILYKLDGEWNDCPCDLTPQDNITYIMPFLCNAPPTTSSPSISPTTLSPTVGDVSYTTTTNEPVSTTPTNSSINDGPTIFIIVIALFSCCDLFACVEFCVVDKKKKGRDIDKKSYQQPAAQMYGAVFSIPSNQASLNMVPS